MGTSVKTTKIVGWERNLPVFYWFVTGSNQMPPVPNLFPHPVLHFVPNYFLYFASYNLPHPVLHFVPYYFLYFTS